MTRGQITIFFMIGIVLVIVVLLLVYVRSVITTEERPSENTAESNQFLTQCVEEELFASLDRLATGDFGERKPFPWNEPGTGTAYGLDGTGSTEQHTTLGILPDEESLVAKRGGDTASYTSNIFGTNKLQSLCDPSGPNNPSQTTNPQCGPYAYTSENKPGPSIQENFSARLSRAVNTCLAQDVDEAIGVDYSTYGRAATEVLFGNQAITTRTTFSENNVLLEQNFRVRLLPLYNYANERIVFTTRNPTKTMGQDTKSAYYREGFLITRNVLPASFKYTFADTSASFRYGNNQLALTFIVDMRPPYNDSDGALYDLDLCASCVTS